MGDPNFSNASALRSESAKGARHVGARRDFSGVEGLLSAVAVRGVLPAVLALVDTLAL
jgi:hypothetical protein